MAILLALVTTERISIGVIIVHYGEVARTIKCIQSYVVSASRLAVLYPNFIVKIFVVDNSRNFIPHEFDGLVTVEVLTPKHNLGYAGGVSFACKVAEDVNFYLISNNDLEVDRECLSELIKASLELPTVGAIQPLVFGHGKKGNSVDSLGSTTNPLMHCFGYSNWPISKQSDFIQGTVKAREIFAVDGVLIFIASELWKKFQWDGAFFMFNEDILLSWRLEVAGFSNYLIHNAKVTHIRGGTAKGVFIKQNPVFPSYYISRNKLLSILYMYDPGWLIQYFVLALYFEFIKNFFLALRCRDGSHLYYFLKALLYLLKDSRHIRAQRMTTIRIKSSKQLLKEGRILSLKKSIELLVRMRRTILNEPKIQ